MNCFFRYDYYKTRLNDPKIKAKAIERLKREKGIDLPDNISYSSLCDAITDAFLLSKIKRQNGLTYKFVRLYAQSGIPKELRAIKKQNNTHVFYKTRAFLLSEEWYKLRYEAIIKYGNKCQCCGADSKSGPLNVDHIKPRVDYPELATDINNLQVLCERCNKGKGWQDQTDWRK